jgi:hypothetical protein
MASGRSRVAVVADKAVALSGLNAEAARATAISASESPRRGAIVAAKSVSPSFTRTLQLDARGKG